MAGEYRGDHGPIVALDEVFVAHRRMPLEFLIVPNGRVNMMS